MYNNIIILDLWQKYRSSIYSKSKYGSSINLLAIDKVMDYECITTEDRPLIARKLILYTDVITNKIHEKAVKNG